MVKSSFIKALLTPDGYSHDTSSISLIETHISWVLLTGYFSYKIKKPVDFGFLDFSTLEKRRFYCHEEVRLNTRLAPNLYLGVSPIYGSSTSPSFSGEGEPIEYAVRMNQFDGALVFDKLARNHQINKHVINELADSISKFHLQAPKAGIDTPFGTPNTIRVAVDENFNHLLEFVNDSFQIEILQRLSDWSNNAFTDLEKHLLERKVNGYIKECHGDLHLGNIVMYNGYPVPFDCIEFNPTFRWIDVISDISFLFMDLSVHNCDGLAYRFLNCYLEHTGDYYGLNLLSYYVVYRSLVRAKVLLLALTSQNEASQIFPGYKDYIKFAYHIVSPRDPVLMITFGLSGSGKSFVSGGIADTFPAIRIRSDVERKRLATELDKRTQKLESATYSKEFSDLTYARLADMAEFIMESGFSVIVDATFLNICYRKRFMDIAKRLGRQYCILDINAPIAIIRQRLTARIETSNDPSDATLSVLDQQISSFTPLTAYEKERSIIIKSAERIEIAEIVQNIRSLKSL